MMEKTIFCNNKCIHYRRSCQMLSNFFGNHHPRNGRGKGKVKTSVTFCEMQRLMLQTFSAPTFLLPLMFAILRERLYLDCNAVPRDLRKIKYFFPTMSSPTKNSIKDNGFSFRRKPFHHFDWWLLSSRKSKKKSNVLTIHPLCIIPKYFYVITFINCNGYKNGAFLYFSSPKSFTQTQFVITLERK